MYTRKTSSLDRNANAWLFSPEKRSQEGETFWRIKLFPQYRKLETYQNVLDIITRIRPLQHARVLWRELLDVNYRMLSPNLPWSLSCCFLVSPRFFLVIPVFPVWIISPNSSVLLLLPSDAMPTVPFPPQSFCGYYLGYESFLYYFLAPWQIFITWFSALLSSTLFYLTCDQLIT